VQVSLQSLGGAATEGQPVYTATFKSAVQVGGEGSLLGNQMHRVSDQPTIGAALDALDKRSGLMAAKWGEGDPDPNSPTNMEGVNELIQGVWNWIIQW